MARSYAVPGTALLPVRTSRAGIDSSVESSTELLDRSGLGPRGRLRWSPDEVRGLTTFLLRGNSDRLAHSLRAGMQARHVLATVPADDADLLVSAALLHDIGYAPDLRQTGFHALDGATFLINVGAPYRLAALVAHHSEARMLAEAKALLGPLSRFHREDGPIADALAYADMTASPTGSPISVSDRLADIAARHADEEPVLRAARLARVPRLLAAERRVRQRGLALR